MSAPYNPEIITCCGALQSLLLDPARRDQSAGRLTKPALTGLRSMYSTFSLNYPTVRTAVALSPKN
jgi:hypothetical protein